MTMAIADVQAILKEVAFMDYTLLATESEYDGRWFMQGSYREACIDTGAEALHMTRRWLLTPYMTKSEVVQTAFKLCLTSMEHRTREHFLFRGRRVYGPHFDVEALWAIAEDATDARKEVA